MQSFRFVRPVLIATLLWPAAMSPVLAATAAKKAVVQSVDRHATELTGLSDQIWAYAETALKEH